MLETTPLSELNKPETAQQYNAGLTGRIETAPDVPTIAPESNIVNETVQDEITPVINGSGQDRGLEQGTDAEELKPGREQRHRDLRLDVARTLKRKLDTDETLSLDEILKIANSIEKLTSGKKLRMPPKSKKQGLFGSQA